MDANFTVGALNANEPMMGGSGPHLSTPDPQSVADTLMLMGSNEPMAPKEADDAMYPKPPPIPCECNVFRYVPPPPRPSAKPPRVYCPSKTPFDDRSIYRISYLPVCGPRTPEKPFKHPDNIRPPPVPMVCETTTRFSFPFWGCVERLSSAKPCHRRTVGDGCISDVSTFRADFKPPMCPVVPPKVYPVPALTTPDVPMEGLSLMRASYTAPRCAEPRATYKPMMCYNCAPFDDTTLHRSSYVPWPVSAPITPPWSKRTAFLPPDKPMESVSMYGSTYIPPGSFLQVPCSDLRYEKKMEAYDPCRMQGKKPGRLPTDPMPFRQVTGLTTAKEVC